MNILLTVNGIPSPCEVQCREDDVSLAVNGWINIDSAIESEPSRPICPDGVAVAAVSSRDRSVFKAGHSSVAATPVGHEPTRPAYGKAVKGKTH